MNKKIFNRQAPLRFKQFTRKSFALFACVGREVIICTLSVATLTYAKADGISIHEELAADTIRQHEKTLDEVIVNASRAPLRTLQAAKVVALVSKDDIQHAAAQSINDILKLVSSVDVRQRGGFGVQTDISINGGTFDQVTILLNGINISNPQTGHNAADFLININDIDHIEVLEGASSRIYGGSAFSGAINIVTLSESDVSRKDKSALTWLTEAGSHGTFNTSATINGKTHRRNNTTWMTTGSGGYARSDGGTPHSDYEKGQVYARALMRSPITDIDIQAGYQGKSFGANTFYTPKYDNQFEKTGHALISASSDVRPFSNQINIRPSVYFNRFDDHYQLIRGAGGSNNGENFHETDVFGAMLEIEKSWSLGETILGGSYRNEHIYSTAYGNPIDTRQKRTVEREKRSFTREAERDNTSIFLEHNMLIDHLTISAGIHVNNYSSLEDSWKVFPGIDASYLFSEHLKLHLSWNKAFRLPTFTDLYTKNVVQVGNLNLLPEENNTLKTTVTYIQNRMTLTLSAFHNKGKNMIDWVYPEAESQTYEAMNIGKLTNNGITFNGRYSTDKGYFSIGYAYINQEHHSDMPVYKSLYVLEYLRHKVTLQAHHRITKHLEATAEGRWQQRENGHHPYWKIDGKVEWRQHNYELFIKADNITDHKYYDFGNIPQPGIWLMAGGSLKLFI